MKICFVLNDIKTEKCETSVIIMRKAHQRGHDVYIMGVGDFIFKRDKGVALHCKKIPETVKNDSKYEFWKQMRSDDLKEEVIASREMDIFLLRNNPSEEIHGRQWAEHSGIAWGRMLQKHGALVLNDAVGLSQAYIDKLYFEELPAEIKPNSLITRNKDDILKFWEENGGQMVLKPLEGSRGKDVYKIGPHKHNLNQIIDTITARGYVIAQEYIPEASQGDNRVLVLNGKILEQDGEVAIIHRLNADKSEFRNNLALGGTPKRGELTSAIEDIVSIVGSKLVQDGLFFVGLDIVKDKLIEINALSPGDMHENEITGMPDFTDTIVDAIERKVYYKKESDNKLSNSILATMD